MAVAGEIEGLGQVGAGLFVVGVGRCEVFLDACELRGDAFLLVLEYINGDGAGVVCVEQLLPLSGEDDPLLLHPAPFGCCGGLEYLEVLENQFLDAVPEVRRERDGAVLVLKELLDELHRHGLPLAVGDPAGPSGADEIEVLGAPLVAGGCDHEA
ncbi:MAG: hypothetical protein ACJ71T_06080 [Actinomycetales bacterium]